jgi:catechol 2,3-dioxygenase-like lactoylglutathione lyase family enzyme
LVIGCREQAPSEAQTPSPTIVLDHVVFAVNDLEATAARFRSFGFALKPGRPHDNGIRNEHVKFTDGTELELLTAPAARDALTTTYRRHLAAGDGPAFLALMVRPGAAPIDKPPYIFFGGRNASPTDRPQHFAHANTAETLAAVWLAADDFVREKALLSRYGARTEPVRRKVNGLDAEVVRLADGGAIYLLPARARLKPDRPIVGVTFRLKDVAAAAGALREAGVVVSTSDTESLLLAPAQTGGLWIELAGNRLR